MPLWALTALSLILWMSYLSWYTLMKETGDQ